MFDRPIAVAAHARETPGKVAIAWGNRRISFGELDGGANRAAHALRRRGVETGDHVAVALKNRPEFFEVAVAASRLAADIVPVSWRYQADEVRYMVEDSGAKVLVAEGAGPDGGVTVPVLRHGGSYEEARDAEDPAPLADAPDPAPVHFLYYTSGTTGRPKAIRRARPDPQAFLAGVLLYAAMYEVDASDHVHLACGPLYHTAPSAYATYALTLGQSVVLMERFDAAECLRLIESEGVTWTHMVPINFVRILGLPDEVRARHDLSSMRRVLHAAAPCPVDVKLRIMADVFPGDVVWEYYGMTEGLGTFIKADEYRRKPGSVGRAAPTITLKILDDEGNELPPGEVGLVYVSPLGGIPFEYAGAPEKTAAAYRGGLFTVGDMGYLDEDGYLFLTDRKIDMIITGGANVYPAEVEAALFGHPAVADAVVIGVPDDEWGEAVKAIVEARTPVSADELISWCRERLAHYKCPRTVDFVAEMPRDENGKVRKRHLRDRYWEGRARKI